MRFILAIILAACCTASALAGQDVASVLQRAPVLNPNLSAFPESSLIDRSSQLEAPAGKHGFLSAKDGHFVFEDGQRARFFGINLAKDTVFIDKAQIDRLSALFARAGINLVRIHHIDDAKGILDPTPAQYFRPDRLDLVDYWVAKLKERGIYVCLDLNDYRTFRTDEGVRDGEKLGRGAKPYAVFDQRLIELQQEYARKFLTEHVNPYTQLSYAKDPAIAFLEIYDENGLFIRRADWQTLHSTYQDIFKQQWNAWLRYKYGTTATLRAIWTDRRGTCALTPGESLELANINLPKMGLGNDLSLLVTDPLTAPARVADGALFAAEMQTAYLKMMTGYLREIGVRVPVTAVGAQDVIPDLLTTATTTDYIGINYYWDHPNFLPGRDWTMPAFFSLKNPLTDNLNYSFPATVSLARMHNKPLVVRELGYCYPNPYRGVGMIEAAAYGAFLDVDALILFTYDAYQQARTIGFFDIHLDPLRWGLVSQSSRLFLSGEVTPARNTVGIGYSQVDAHTWHSYLSSLYQLSFATRVVNYTDTSTANPLSLLVASGRSAGSGWQGDHLLLFANQDHADLHFQSTFPGLDERNGYLIQTGRGGSFDFTFRGWIFDTGVTKSVQTWPGYSLADVTAKGLQPVATNDTLALGLYDPARKIFGFRNLRHDLAVRLSLDALHDWYNAPISHRDLDQNRWRTDTGQMERNQTTGVLHVDTPTVQALAGQLNSGPQSTSALRITTATPVGTLVAESLDGAPLAHADTYLIKMTTKARNDQVKLTPSKEGPKPHKLDFGGTAPIRTDGIASTTPTRVELNGQPVLEIYLQNGTWEYLTSPGRSLLYLDSGDITINLPKTPKSVRWHIGTNVMEVYPESGRLTVPSGVQYTEIEW